jgi:phosphoglucosamine mutase
VLRFGTDGVRGVANADLTPEVVLALGRAASRVLGGWRFVVGRDTRISGSMLEAALSAGLASEGAQVLTLGVVPTPVVAHFAATEGMPGAMISASHNPYTDNGVKLFAAGGRKLEAPVEAALEAELHALLAREAPSESFTGDAVGSIVVESAIDHYAAAINDSIAARSFAGMHAVVDCANGAASVIGPQVLRSLGVTVDVIHAEPDGTNINAGCGSTHPADLQRAVMARSADVGIAFDGDADRVILVDSNGQIVDGDEIIAVCASDLHKRGRLTGETIVVTVMSNLGLRVGMRDRGIHVIETPVGDRHVMEVLEAEGFALGGEQSGHVIFREVATTGDGLLTAVQVLDVMARTEWSLADLVAASMTKLPQVLRNIRIEGGAQAVAERAAAQVQQVADRLGDEGRVLVRASGTEPVVRVMVEATSSDLSEQVADELASIVETCRAE